MKLTIYSDETEFQKGNEKYVGCGYLCLDEEISSEIINIALNALKNDPDIYKPKFKKQDFRTIQNKYFHASDDSQNAHSHLCDSIRERVSGNFDYFYYKPDNVNSSQKNNDVGKIQNFTLMLSSMIISNLMPDKITFIIEERNTFSQIQANSWIDNLYKMKEKSIYDYPSIPSLFPHIEIIIKDKSESGLQLADFILWAVNRSNMIPSDLTWLERLELKFRQSINDINGPIESGSYRLKDGVKSHFIKYPDSVLPIKDGNTNQDLIDSFILIEKSLKNALNNSLPDRVNHLKTDLSEKVEKLKNKDLHFSTELIQQSASIFLRLFDTLPLYKNFSDNDFEKWNKILFARKIAGLILRNDLPHGVNTMDYLTKYRRKIINEDPSILE